MIRLWLTLPAPAPSPGREASDLPWVIRRQAGIRSDGMRSGRWDHLWAWPRRRAPGCRRRLPRPRTLPAMTAAALEGG
jgi:hypothetical protein